MFAAVVAVAAIIAAAELVVVLVIAFVLVLVLAHCFFCMSATDGHASMSPGAMMFQRSTRSSRVHIGWFMSG